MPSLKQKLIKTQTNAATLAAMLIDSNKHIANFMCAIDNPVDADVKQVILELSDSFSKIANCMEAYQDSVMQILGR